MDALRGGGVLLGRDPATDCCGHCYPKHVRLENEAKRFAPSFSLRLFPGPFFLSRPSIPFPVYPFPPPQIAGRAKREGGRFADSSSPPHLRPHLQCHKNTSSDCPFFEVDGQSSLMTLGDCRADARRRRGERDADCGQSQTRKKSRWRGEGIEP